MLEALDKSFGVYNHAGFQIKEVFADPEFKFMKNPLIDIDIKLHISAAQEHVAEIKRMIRIIKERYRAMYSHLSYRPITKTMIIYRVMNCVEWINIFPPKGGATLTVRVT